jgi:hypothetical protein
VKFIAALLGAMVVVLMALAHASPIDPSTPGFWDDGDYDDVIIFLTSHLHFLDVDPLPVIAVSQGLLQYVVEHLVRAVPEAGYEPGSPRAPPAVSRS